MDDRCVVCVNSFLIKIDVYTSVEKKRIDRISFVSILRMARDVGRKTVERAPPIEIQRRIVIWTVSLTCLCVFLVFYFCSFFLFFVELILLLGAGFERLGPHC